MSDYSPVIAPEFVSPLYKELAYIDSESLSPIFKRKGTSNCDWGAGSCCVLRELCRCHKGIYSYCCESGLVLCRAGCLFELNCIGLSLLEYSIYLDSIHFEQESHKNIHKRENVYRTNGIPRKWNHMEK